MAAGPVAIDIERHVVTIRGDQVALPLKEFELLEFLVRNEAGSRPGTVDRPDLGQRLCRRHQDPGRAHQACAKVEPTPEGSGHILTVRGLGYKYEA